MMQARLILLGLVVLAFMGLGLVAYHYKVEARDAVAESKQARADLKVAKDVNDSNQATIGRLQAQAASDARLTAQLAGQLADANQVFIDNTTAVHQLKDANADVSHFLALPVPPALRQLYDGSGAAGGR